MSSSFSNFQTTASNEKHLKKLRASELFDPEWYSETYPDVRMLGIDPAEHYLKFGALLQRDPGPKFSSRFYIDTHRTVKRGGLNPLLHYLTRKPFPKASPNPQQVLWAAGSESLRGKSQRAIDLAEQYLPEAQRYTISLLRANHAALHRQEEKWLEEVNTFLDHYDIAPLQLRAGYGSLFPRLGTGGLTPVTEGPVVSIIMPAWNAEKTVEYAIRSLLQQTWQPLEIIVVDDASTDQTWSIIQTLAAPDSRIKALRNKENVGPYVSKNIALGYASGAYITGHDADDWAHPQRIEKHINYLLTEHQSVSLMGMLRMSDQGMFTKLSQIGANTKDGACVSAFISMMCERNLFRTAVGHWDEMRFGGDSELIQRLQVVIRKDVRRFHCIGMFCLDNPDGLTNHPEFGHKPGSHIAPERKEYKNSFVEWHQTLEKDSAYLNFPQEERAFQAPATALNPTGVVKRVFDAQRDNPARISERVLKADLVIVTNLRFPGGNASSTLDELRYFTDQGREIMLVHCPVDPDLGKTTSERYDGYADKVVTFHDFKRLECKTLIVRHPAVACSFGFERFKHKLAPENVYFVINNSKTRTSGVPVYSVEKVYEHAQGFADNGAKTAKICPISPLMRDELVGIIPDAMLSNGNWTPTFDLEAYKHAPKAAMQAPYNIGRHGRDGPEKWLEDKDKLLQAFPQNVDFSISILGGAKNAGKILGGLPGNWTVHEFGSIPPKDYLEQLDAFVYFPNTNLNEGFGRTIAEAMIGGVPCILPPKFHQVFEDLAFYAEPDQVARVIRELARHGQERRAFLGEVQAIAERCFSTTAIGSRFQEWMNTPNATRAASTGSALEISERSRAFRNHILNATAE
jgi:glycosyltransferase involved in cell wall biosynthesis